MIAILLLFLSAMPAVAFDEPKDFRGLKFNEPLESQIPNCRDVALQVTREHKEGCWSKSNGVYLIHQLGPLAGVYISSTIVFPINGLIGMLNLSFAGSQFSTIVSLFKERYGQPTDEKESNWISKAGTKLPNRTLGWLGENIQIELVKLGSNRDLSEATFTTKLWRDSKADEMKKKIKDAAKDL
jgi:hypothetical protein